MRREDLANSKARRRPLLLPMVRPCSGQSLGRQRRKGPPRMRTDHSSQGPGGLLHDLASATHSPRGLDQVRHPLQASVLLYAKEGKIPTSECCCKMQVKLATQCLHRHAQIPWPPEPLSEVSLQEITTSPNLHSSFIK